MIYSPENTIIGSIYLSFMTYSTWTVWTTLAALVENLVENFKWYEVRWCLVWFSETGGFWDSHMFMLTSQHSHFSSLLLNLTLAFLYPTPPQDPAPSHSRGHAGNGSMFVNEAAFSSTSINNRHVNHKRNDPSAHNCLNTLLARSNSRNSPKAKARHDPQSDPQSSGGRQTGYLYSTTGRLGPQHAPPGETLDQRQWRCRSMSNDPALSLKKSQIRDYYRFFLSHPNQRNKIFSTGRVIDVGF